MKILNFGSLNIDYVYETEHFVTAGETEAAERMERHVGGKGLNQSAALAKAGAKVFHAGRVGKEGDFLTGFLKGLGVDTSLVEIGETPTGHAVIQVDAKGQNAILLFKGANGEVNEEQIERVLEAFDAGDMVLLQNEISGVGRILKKAHEKGMVTVLNPSPLTKELADYPLDAVDWFILNEIEGKGLTGESAPEKILKALRTTYRSAKIVLTLGKEGAIYSGKGPTGEEEFRMPAGDGKPVDTTAAGDTFTGYFFATIAAGGSPKEAMRRATEAANITVTRKGAAESIPFDWELKG